MTKDYITLFRVILYDRPTPAEFADVNDAVIEDWKADTTPYERIRHVIADTYQPVSAAAVADDAQTAPKTARKHLNTLADEGFVETEPGKQGGTLYCRSSVSLVVEQAADILEHVSTDELATRIQEMRKQFTEYQVEFGVDSPEELAVDQTNQALTERDLHRMRPIQRRSMNGRHFVVISLSQTLLSQLPTPRSTLMAIIARVTKRPRLSNGSLERTNRQLTEYTVSCLRDGARSRI